MKHYYQSSNSSLASITFVTRLAHVHKTLRLFINLSKIKMLPAVVILLLSTTLVSAQANQATMTNTHVIKLVKSGLDNDIIITTIESATGKFDVTTDGLVSLKTAGVPAPVIKSMVAKMQAVKNVKQVLTPSTTVAAARMVEPEIINAIYAYNKSSSGIKALEKNNATQKVHRAGLGYGATTYTCEIPGDKSATRLTVDEAKSFVINTGAAAPEAITLYRVESKKKLRSAITSKITGLGSMKGSQGSIACNVKMLKNGVYEILPSDKLENGEYFFTTRQLDYTTMQNMDVYAFGVD